MKHRLAMQMADKSKPKLAVQLDVRVSRDVHEHLHVLAANRRGGMSAIVRDAIALHLGRVPAPLQAERPELAMLGALPAGDAMRGEELIEVVSTSHGEVLTMAVAGLTNLAASYHQLAALASLRAETRGAHDASCRND